MKRLLFSLVLCAIFVASVSATPACLDGGTMASYIALGSGGCSVGELVFSDFAFGGTPVYTDVTVGVVENGNQVGLKFVYGWDVPRTPGGVIMQQDNLVEFQVNAGLGFAISELYLAIYGVSDAGRFGESGYAAVDEQFVYKDKDGGERAGSLSVVYPDPGADPPPGLTYNSYTFSEPVTWISTTKDIKVAVGSLNDRAAISAASNLFTTTETPEPATMALLGAGLLVVVTAARRRVHR